MAKKTERNTVDMNAGLDFLSELIMADEDDSLFEEEPVEIDEFVYSKEYLHCPPLSQVQFEYVEALSDIYYGCKYTECVAEWGKGSGKDFVCAISLAAVVYHLQCLKNPATYYGLKSGSWIEAVNMAVNAEQAGSVFFSQFKSLIDESPYFRKLRPSISGHRVNFPKKVRAISGHSEMEALEGHNVLVAVLDEIDAFKTDQELKKSTRLKKSARKIYDGMRSSSQSRFPGIGKVASISYPRFHGSFIQQRRIAGLKEPKTFVSAPEGVPTWVANPLRSRSDFDDEYAKDPISAAAMYECKPPMARDQYIRYGDFVLFAMGAKMDGYDIVFDTASGKQIREVHGYSPPRMLPDPEAQYFIHIDLGLNRDRAGFALVHSKAGRLKVDLLHGFEAPPGGEIDFEELFSFILSIHKMGFNITKVTYDGWNSAQSIQNLRKLGFEAEVKIVKKDQYDTIKDLFYQNSVDGIYYQLVIEELLGLELINGKKVDHKPEGSKDVADALAGATWQCVKAQEFGQPDIVVFGESDDDDDDDEYIKIPIGRPLVEDTGEISSEEEELVKRMFGIG